MITYRKYKFSERPRADQITDCSLGNILFFIAGTIGIAVKNGYDYGFTEWNNSEFFVNPLPPLENGEYKEFDLGWGFKGFDVPDGSSLSGWMQTEKYFIHCEALVRHYFTLKDLADPIKDTIIVHYRAFIDEGTLFVPLTREYYLGALRMLPDKRIVVVTDNVNKAKETLGLNVEYISNSPIKDFYLLANSDYLIMSNSSFSWWGSWLSKAITVAPSSWLQPFVNQDCEDLYCKNWIIWK